jgi:hypothetical protein
MSDDEGSGPDDPFEALDLLRTEPSKGQRHLPRLLDQLADPDQTVRIGALAAICYAASEVPDLAEYLTRRLVDRLGDGDPSTETTLAFQYLEATNPETVRAELEALDAERTEQALIRTMDGSLLRPGHEGPEIGRTSSGRANESLNAADVERGVMTEGIETPDIPTTTMNVDTAGTTSESPTQGDEGTEPGDDADDTAVSNAGYWEPADKIPEVEAHSRFDSVTVLAKRAHQRYGDLYRTLGEVGDDQEGVGLVLFHMPDGAARPYLADLRDQLAVWADISNHPNVLTLWDWGLVPQPWAATAYAAERLTDRDQFTVEDAIWQVLQLADALSYLHDRGVIHAGLDPGNVAYYAIALEEGERQQPQLTNVGLMHVVRRYFDPTTRLDPRYAAPEYYDRQYGQIDMATDVYHLGALLYRYLTGNAPYTGEYEEIRTGVLSQTVPQPTASVDIPSELDAVVEKAMARQKLHRYETVTHLAHELRGIGVTEEDDI